MMINSQVSPLRQRILVILAAAVSLGAGYCLRYYDMTIYQAIGTYPGDIWYIHMNYGSYLAGSGFFRMEYPAGLFLLFKAVTMLTIFISGSLDYKMFLSIMSTILSAFGLAATYLLVKIQRLVQPERKDSLWRELIFWAVAPSFIFYALLNFDLPAVFFTLLSVYFRLKQEDDMSAVALGLGVAAKLFPVVLIPLFLIGDKPRQAIRYCAVAGGTWLLLNISFMLLDFNAWLFPYLWQITREPTKDGLVYLIYRFIGSPAASAFFPILYAVTILYAGKSWLRGATRIHVLLAFTAPVLLSFLLANRIFSPQYLLWVLPFFVLAPRVSLILFYICDITNVSLTLFLFKYMNDYPVLSICLRGVRYLSLVIFYVQTLHAATSVTEKRAAEKTASLEVQPTSQNS